MKFIRSSLPFLVASFGLVFSLTAAAQYMWLDAAGRKVFSDQPPPANIPAKRVLQQPGKASATPVASSETEEKPAAKSVAAEKIASKDKDLEAAKKKIEDEETAKKKAEQEKIDAAKAENCKRAKSAKATLDSGMRLAHTNAKGERGFMDDASRKVESKRIEGIIASDCK
jgi:type IV secretory pathway VirB10-like protein